MIYRVTKIEVNSQVKIERFVHELDDEFVPSLSSKVNIHDWSVKLMKLAMNYCVLNSQGEIKAMVSFYPNEGKESYISFIAVSKEFRGKGIADKLLKKSIEHCIEIKSTCIRVQTWLSNEKIIQIYHENKFKDYEINNDRGNEKSLVLLRGIK